MFLLGCRGSNDSFTAKSPRKLAEQIFDDAKETAATVCLFNMTYRAGCTLNAHSEDLFNFARKYFQFLNRAARNNNVPSVDAIYSDYAALRGSLVDFFAHILKALDSIGTDEESIDSLKKKMVSFQLLVGTINTLPDYIVQNCTSEQGNDCGLASYHMYHLYLELVWLQFTIYIKILSKNSFANEEPLLDTEQLFLDQPQTPTNNIELEKEIKWLLYNLISLAYKAYEKRSSHDPFSCSCITEIWINAFESIEKMHAENNASSFWHYYNDVIKECVLNKPDGVQKFTCNIPHKMAFIKCEKPIDFSVCLLSKVANLIRKKYDGDSTKTANFELLETIVRTATNTEQSIPEVELRKFMKHILQLFNIWSEPKNDVVAILWEYFNKRLNSAFLITGEEDTSVSFQNFSLSNTVFSLQCKNTTSYKSYAIENSFHLFCALLGIHLNRCTANNSNSLCQKLKGRILPKFTINKISALNEYGLKNFSTVFLTMAISTDIKSMCEKIQELLLQLPNNELTWKKKQVLLKTNLTIVYLYVINGVNIERAVLPLKSLINAHSASRDTESMAFIKNALTACMEIIDASSELQNDEYLLIDDWTVKYLTVCNISDMYGILENFTTLLSKLQALCSYQINPSMSITSMINAMFTHIFPCVKSLFANGTSAIQIAELAFNFVKFPMDINSDVVKKYGTFQSLLKSFLDVSNTNERVIQHFLVLLLGDYNVLQTLNCDNSECQGLIVRSWIKCMLPSKDAPSNDDDQLLMLMNQLDEFSSLNATVCSSNQNENILSNFFYALGQSWDNTEELREKSMLKKRINTYLRGIDAHIAAAIKTPTSSDVVMKLFIVLGALFLHCSSIIYTRADPTCLLHSLIGSILLPPQLFMEKRIHPYTANGVCKSWYMYMKGLHGLDCKSDTYIDKAMKDMIVQYLPFFTEKTLASKDRLFNVSHRMIPIDCGSDMSLEKYILEKIAVTFVTCRGKQCHPHSTKALSIILHLCHTSNVKFLHVIISSTLICIFEQLMFSDAANPNKRISELILNTLCNNTAINNCIEQEEIRNMVRENLAKTCTKHLAFNSAVFFKLVLQLIQILGSNQMNIFLSTLKMEIGRVENMRGVGYDQGLRTGINEIESHMKKVFQ